MSSSLSPQQALLASSVAFTVVAVSLFTYQRNKRVEKSYPIDDSCGRVGSRGAAALGAPFGYFGAFMKCLAVSNL
jgi:hypothetical protein